MPCHSLIPCRQRASGGSKTPHENLFLRVLWVCVWTSANEMSNAHGYLTVQSLMSLTVHELHPMQRWVAAFLSDFLADITAGITDQLHRSPKWWSEYVSEEILSKELHSRSFRLFFQMVFLINSSFPWYSQEASGFPQYSKKRWWLKLKAQMNKYAASSL